MQTIQHEKHLKYSDEFGYTGHMLPIIISSMGMVDDLSFFEYLSQFCCLLIQFHCTFSISYKILQYFVCYYFNLIR